MGSDTRAGGPATSEMTAKCPLSEVDDGHVLVGDQRVEFHVGRNPRNGKPRAMNVRVVG